MITIQLSDDVAIDIMGQLSGQVAGKLATKGTQINGKTYQGDLRHDMRTAILQMKKGTIFRNVDFQIKFGADVSAVSGGLSQLREEGKVKMVHRGTYEVL